jgi:hypothetical protein
MNTTEKSVQQGVKIMQFPRLTRNGNRYNNVHCGTVDWNGNRTSGCGRSCETLGFYYQVGGCTSEVSFCADCAKKYEAQYTPDMAFHQHNIENDESVFGG